MRIALVLLMLAAPSVWASPPPAKSATVAKREPQKAEPAKKPVEKKAEPINLERRTDTKKASTLTSTLSLKKPSRHVTLPDWAP